MKSWLTKVGKLPLGVAMACGGFFLLSAADWQILSAVALAAVAIAAWELGGLLGRPVGQRLVLAGAVALAGPLSLWLLAGRREAYDEFFAFVLAFWVAVVPLWMLMKPKLPKPALAASGAVVLICAWLGVTLLAEYDRLLLILGLVAVWLVDTAGWFFGNKFGNRPLAAQISPNKTWEGLVGGLFTVYVFVTFCWFLAGRLHPHWVAVLLGAALCALAVLGDLAESQLKRIAKVKDSSGLLGSHGGLLD
ncbi:MAG: phosphatidate cytidylyltransferase, partial [Betaproteobacteria bacterium]|nr:phosphatidate cytidylyltransferase [Betaproteobacteria bacterium]